MGEILFHCNLVSVWTADRDEMSQWFWIMTWTDENSTISLFRSVRVEILPKLCVCQSSMEMTESFSKMKLVPQTKCSPVEILSKAGECGGSKWKKKIERPRIIFPSMKHSRFNSKAKAVKCLTCVESYFHISFKQFPPPRKIGVLNICSIWMSWFTALRLLQYDLSASGSPEAATGIVCQVC